MPRKSDVSNSVSGNPDIAVALHYDGSNTPRVTAKGEDRLAAQIIEAAEHFLAFFGSQELLELFHFAFGALLHACQLFRFFLLLFR